MFCFQIFFLLFNILKTVISEGCVCMPAHKCHPDDFVYFEDSPAFTVVNLWGSACDNDYDVCCKIKCGQRKSENLPVSDFIRLLKPDKVVADFAEFPWMLAILQGKTYRCGGSLIHPKIALTAAHCVQDRSTYKIRAGEWDRGSLKEPLRHQDRRSEKIITHPYYNSDSLVNDIALIILKRPFDLADNVGVVCLPPPNAAPIPDECIVTGWGRTSHKSRRNSKTLNKGIFPIVSNRECEAALQRATLGPLYSLHQTFMCAGGGGKDTCEGDGGSPLMCEVRGANDVYEQFGIASWGLLCGVYGTPGVYVGVARFVKWIDHQVKTNGFNSDVYKYQRQ